MFIDFPKQNNIQHFKGPSPLKKNKRNKNKNKNKKGNKTRQKQKQKQTNLAHKNGHLYRRVTQALQYVRQISHKFCIT